MPRKHIPADIRANIKRAFASGRMIEVERVPARFETLLSEYHIPNSDVFLAMVKKRTPEDFTAISSITLWVRQNKNRAYIPEDVLKALNETVDDSMLESYHDVTNRGYRRSGHSQPFGGDN